MDKDRVHGTARQVKGAVKEAVGKVTGDAKTEIDGAVEKNVGKAQANFGKTKDALKR